MKERGLIIERITALVELAEKQPVVKAGIEYLADDIIAILMLGEECNAMRADLHYYRGKPPLAGKPVEIMNRDELLNLYRQNEEQRDAVAKLHFNLLAHAKRGEAQKVVDLLEDFYLSDGTTNNTTTETNNGNQGIPDGR